MKLYRLFSLVALFVVLFVAVAPVAAAPANGPKLPGWFKKVWEAWAKYAPRFQFDNLDCQEMSCVVPGGKAYREIVKWWVDWSKTAK